tara:strand:+ start:2177 stop:2680 length:504 start_codon:yes stop_codon:yes gene_type:complete
MKKLIYLTIVSLLIISCQQNNQTDKRNSKMNVFNKNTETTKAWLNAFMQNDSTTLFSDKYVSDDFIWSPPAVGMDSLPKSEWEEAFRGFMSSYDNKVLTNPQYYAALDEENLPDGNVRVYGTWNSNFATTGKKNKLKWYAVFQYNEDGKMSHYMEWYDSADLTKEFN